MCSRSCMHSMQRHRSQFIAGVGRLLVGATNAAATAAATSGCKRCLVLGCGRTAGSMRPPQLKALKEANDRARGQKHSSQCRQLATIWLQRVQLRPA